MLVETVLTADQANPQKLRGKTVIILDVLRAATNIVNALANGCEEVIPALTIKEALSLAKSLELGSYLLGGERKREKIQGFDLGNSPGEYISEKVKGKKIIITTTNGTKAIGQAVLADHILIGSLLNVSTVGRYSLSLAKDIIILCSGTRGCFSLEDSIAAGSLVDYLIQKEANLILDDLSLALRQLYKSYFPRLLEPLSISENGRSLLKMGKEEDVKFAAQLDIYQVVPIWNQGKIKLIS